MNATLKELFEKNISKEIKKQIMHIVETYNSNNFECWLVGGPVRDLILERKPHDFDFATNCPLEKTKELFDHVIETGEDHGTLTVHISGNNYEITRYRKDVDTDGRRATIEFSNTIEEDLLRRDLTVNAIAFNPNTSKIVDVSGGINDIKTKTLRFVGKTEDRILEDNLRFIRVLRFKIKLKFEIEKNILNEAKKVFDVKKLSRERIYDEFEKMFDCGISDEEKEFLINSMCDVMDFDYKNHLNNKSNEILRDIFSTNSLYPIVYHNGWSESCRLPTKFKKIDCMLRYIENLNEINTQNIKKLMSKFTESNIFVIKTVLQMHSHFKGSDLENSLCSLNEVINSKCPIFIHELKIDGDKLISMGFKGKKIGEILNWVLELVHNDEKYNTFEKLSEEILNKYD